MIENHMRAVGVCVGDYKIETSEGLGHKGGRSQIVEKKAEEKRKKKIKLSIFITQIWIKRLIRQLFAFIERIEF